ncbi:MAG TPA: ParB N-terminal domain-containing protein [Microthrixaceae bacterium]|nr:ParB N-terminal domain-containing protein [Microthrixaceae bacterium]
MYSTETARAAAERDELVTWVVDFLSSPGSDNEALGASLHDEGLTWAGPIRLAIEELNRLAGPSDHPVLQPVDDDEWRDDVDELARHIEAGAEPPPVIVTYRDDRLVLEDGNHRVEAIRRAGRDAAWAIVGFDDIDDCERFIARSARPPKAG